MLNIAVCGEGPIALTIAAVCGWRGYAVRLLSANAGRWRNWIEGRLPDGLRFAGGLELVTADIRVAVARADIVFVCVSHYEIEDVLRRLAPHVRADTLVGAIPGFGGFGLLARRTLSRVRCMFGTQRIPFVVGAHVPTRSIFISGIRRQTFVATIPAARAFPVAELLREILGVPTVPVSHYVNVELSPSNSLVNPARLYCLFGPRARKSPRFDEEFFLDWDRSASRVLLNLDRELQMGRVLIPRDTSFVAPILLQYDSNDVATLTRRFQGLLALGQRPVPLRRQRGCYMLNPRSQYIREDIDFGLVLIRDVLRLAGASTPLMDEIIAWRRLHLPTSRAWTQIARWPPSRSFTTIDAVVSALD